MSPLLLIWSTSLALAGAALIWMAGLIVGRLLRERAEGSRERDKTVIQSAFLDIMSGSGDAIGRLGRVQGRARLMAETLLELISLVRGEERDRLISALAAFNIDHVFRHRLFRGSFAGRIAAAEALAIFPGVGSATALRHALASERRSELRVGVMRSLIELGEPPSLAEVLADLAGRRASDSLLYLPLIARLVADDPMTALRAFGDPRLAIEPRVILAEALGGSGDYRALEPLCLATRAPDLELRIACIRALGMLGHPGAETAVLAGLSDKVWMVRSAACESAGRIGLRAAIPLLAHQLRDEVWWVRFRAGEALAALGDTGREQLQRVAASGDDLSRRAASMVLAERGLAAAA